LIHRRPTPLLPNLRTASTPITPHHVYNHTNNSFRWLSIIGYGLAAVYS
jgi:hypothetical protein